jgi:hypothetical protein
VTLRGRWVTLRARWVTFRASWVTLGAACAAARPTTTAAVTAADGGASGACNSLVPSPQCERRSSIEGAEIHVAGSFAARANAVASLNSATDDGVCVAAVVMSRRGLPPLLLDCGGWNHTERFRGLASDSSLITAAKELGEVRTCHPSQHNAMRRQCQPGGAVSVERSTTETRVCLLI